MKYNLEEIKEILPHRDPFLLVDEIIDGEEGKWTKGIKKINIDDPVFQGHFPNHKVYPGVLIIETIAQVGAVCILSEEDNRGKIAFFAGIKNAKFKKEVLPGDTLNIKCELIDRRLNLGFAKAEAYVGTDLVCKCEISFSIS